MKNSKSTVKGPEKIFVQRTAVAFSRSRNLRLSLDVDARIRLCRTHTKSIQLLLQDKPLNKMALPLATTSSSLNLVATLAACLTKMTCNHLCSPTACSSSRMPMMTINSNLTRKCLPALHLCPCPWIIALQPTTHRITCNSEAGLSDIDGWLYYDGTQKQPINRLRDGAC